MRHAIFLALALFCASAQAQFGCLPKHELIPTSTGSTTRSVTTDAGEATVWWCPNTDAAGKLTYRLNILYSLNNRKGQIDLRSSLRRIWSGPNLLDAVNSELIISSIPVTPGSQDEFDVKVLQYRACLIAATAPYQVVIAPLPDNYCGAAPTPPGPAPDVYVTVGSYTLYTTSGGKLVASIKDRKALPNAACSCTTLRIMVGAASYCAVSGGSPTEVTQCKKVVP